MRKCVGTGIKERNTEENAGKSKMAKVYYPTFGFKKGDIISPDSVIAKSPWTEDGIEPFRLADIIGKFLAVDCSTAVSITDQMLEGDDGGRK
jgi:sialic acid synthase SpsE